MYSVAKRTLSEQQGGGDTCNYQLVLTKNLQMSAKKLKYNKGYIS